MRDRLGTRIEDVTVVRDTAASNVHEQTRQAILDAGGTLRRLRAEPCSALVAAMNPVWNQVKAEVGADEVAAAQSVNATTKGLVRPATLGASEFSSKILWASGSAVAPAFRHWESLLWRGTCAHTSRPKR